MKRSLSRRKFMAGLTALGGLATTGCKTETYLPPHLGNLLDASDAMTMSVQRILMTKQSLAPEYTSKDISPVFPVEGTAMPEGESYQGLLDNSFVDFRLPVTGLIDRPLSLSMADIKAFPARTQITSHSCESGWTAIGEWTGVPLAHILEEAGMQKEARYVTFECVDGWYDFLDLFDALHAQTILAYGMNGEDLPVQHGAPVRLRVERHVGYKSLKFVNRINVVEHPEKIPSGGFGRIHDFSWYAGA